MIQLLSRVLVIDNSGAKFARCIKILKPTGKNFAQLGDLVLLSILKTQVLKGNSPREQVQPGDLFKAILVRSPLSKSNGPFSGLHAAVLVKISPKTGEFAPIGSRIKGPLPAALALKPGMAKIISLAKVLL